VELPAFDDAGPIGPPTSRPWGGAWSRCASCWPHGSVIVHVDPKTSHYIKVMCDEIFGDACFASEIVWR